MTLSAGLRFLSVCMCVWVWSVCGVFEVWGGGALPGEEFLPQCALLQVVVCQ